jgi:hypothetical protein
VPVSANTWPTSSIFTYTRILEICQTTMNDSNPRKRPRPVVSCLRCRNKKLKCDRATPCQNCIKASIADTCTYDPDGHILAKEVAPVAATTATASSLEDLQRRMAAVEELLGVKPSAPKVTTINATATVSPEILGTLVVKGNRSIYHGQNDRTTLLNQVRPIPSRLVTYLRFLTFDSSWTSRTSSMACQKIRASKPQPNRSNFCRPNPPP